MSKETSVILLGLFVFVMPLSGFPGAWRTFFIMAAGLALVIIGFFMRSRALGNSERLTTDPFVESIHQAPQTKPGHEEKDSHTD